MKVELPLSIEVLKQTFVDTNLALEVDVANSKIKGKVALVYISNLNLSNISFFKDSLTYEDKKDLLIEYMKLKNTLKLEQLLYSNLEVILTRYNATDIGDDLNLIRNKSILTADDIANLLADSDYLSALDSLENVLDAVPTYAVTMSVWFRETYPEYLNDFNVITDVDYTGFTFVNYVNDFLFQHHYYGLVPPKVVDKPLYFKIHFDDYVYKGKNLGAFMLKENLMLPTIELIMDGTLTPTTLKQHTEELNNASLN